MIFHLSPYFTTVYLFIPPYPTFFSFRNEIAMKSFLLYFQILCHCIFNYFIHFSAGFAKYMLNPFCLFPVSISLYSSGLSNCPSAILLNLHAPYIKYLTIMSLQCYAIMPIQCFVKIRYLAISGNRRLIENSVFRQMDGP
jgi:hypothetical protein